MPTITANFAIFLSLALPFFLIALTSLRAKKESTTATTKSENKKMADIIPLKIIATIIPTANIAIEINE